MEIVYGDIEPQSLATLIEAVMDENTLVIISTDLSHFHTLQEAQRHGQLCMQAVATLNTEALLHGCEACGMLGVKAVLEVAKKCGLMSQLLDYRTSADVTKDNTSVVGYMSALIGDAI